jgi:hypothetical protein
MSLMHNELSVHIARALADDLRRRRRRETPLPPIARVRSW